MPYSATTYNIMIASPSDVIREREVIREIIYDWNVVNSEREKIVLQPIGWDTHSSPSMGDRPQSIINKQILENCDLLIAVFWTRVGSPTGEEISGTVEEIKKHYESGKPIMIYFSRVPVVPDIINHEQYEKLNKFKEWCLSKGLIEQYDSPEDFRQKFYKQFSLSVIRELIHNASVLKESPDNTPRESNQTEMPTRTQELEISLLLNKNQKMLLMEASNDTSGTILRYRTMGGDHVLTNRRDFIEPGNPRSRAEWEDAINQLLNLGLLESRGYKGEVFEITHLGYRVSDFLKSEMQE